MSGTPCRVCPATTGSDAAVLAERAGQEGAVGVGDLVDELFERDAVERELLRVGLDADLVRAAADDEGRADAVDLGQFVLQFLGDLEEAVVGPPARLVGLGRQRQHDDGDVVDAAPDDQRLGDALGDVGRCAARIFSCTRSTADVLVGADEKARGDDDADRLWSANRRARRR